MKNPWTTSFGILMIVIAIAVLLKDAVGCFVASGGTIDLGCLFAVAQRDWPAIGLAFGGGAAIKTVDGGKATETS